ncbi:MAG: LysM peptidoglycan-binding domain-containing protein [Bifidobacteriaceae bacterium]|jgi:nucleoid-associated protein YgaU|nr:LysM peptidoglycan-binding domain-containing protein [Bifidobacteriaceae bacterium]
METRKTTQSRRGRRGWVAAIVGAVIAAGAWAGAAAASGPPAGIEVRLVIVDQGDTLWSIAQRHVEGDTRAAVGRIRRLNGLAGDQLWAGHRLLLPK